MVSQRSVKNRKRIVLILLSLLMVLSLFAPFAAYARKQEQKTVRVGWYESLFNRTGEDGSRSGYAYDYQQKTQPTPDGNMNMLRGNGAISCRCCSMERST